MMIESPRRRWRHTGSPLGSVVIGLLIAAFGVNLLASNLGWDEGRYYFRQAWPAMLVVAGIVMLFRRHPEQSPHLGFWGSACILGGLWVFAAEREWIHVNFWAVFGPTLLVLLGFSFVWRAFHRTPAAPEAAGSDAYIRTSAIMSGHELKPATAPFKGGEISALMGGVMLDLTNVQMDGDTVTLDASATLGGIEILVPREWNVTTKVTSFMGACVDKRRPQAVPGTKTLVVRGSVILGGIDIKD